MRLGSTCLVGALMGGLNVLGAGNAAARDAHHDERHTALLHSVEEGRATYMARCHDGGVCANGEKFDSHHLVAAHPRLPLGTVVRVTNLENFKETLVRIVDRLPSKKRSPHHIIDLSREAAHQLGFGTWKKGVARVRVEVVSLPRPKERKR